MLLTLRRLIAPLRDILNALMRRDDPLIDRDRQPAFSRLHDHTLRLTDALDMYTTISRTPWTPTSRWSVAHHRNIVVKRLTAFSIIMMSMTLVAAIYGMPFGGIRSATGPGSVPSRWR